MSTATIEYGQIEYVEIHLDDLDLMGVVHSARYALLIERAIGGYWSRHGHAFDSVDAHGGQLTAVAEFAINYRVPVRHTGPVGVHFWIERLGTTSVGYGYRIVSADGAVTHADGTRVMIRLDPVSGRPTPWSPAARQFAPALMRPARSAAEEPA